MTSLTSHALPGSHLTSRKLGHLLVLTMVGPLTVSLSVMTTMKAAGTELLETCRTADLLLHNAVVYTADESNSTHQALVIDDGRFVFVGADEVAKGGLVRHCSGY